MKKIALVAATICVLAGVFFFVFKGADADATVKSIVLPIDVPEIAAGPGRDAYTSKCMACHSSRYVTMQPEFPRKVWENEVTKMIKVYGASIDQDQVPDIVGYLVSIRGAPEKSAPK